MRNALTNVKKKSHAKNCFSSMNVWMPGMHSQGLAYLEIWTDFVQLFSVG